MATTPVDNNLLRTVIISQPGQSAAFKPKKVLVDFSKLQYAPNAAADAGKAGAKAGKLSGLLAKIKNSKVGSKIANAGKTVGSKLKGIGTKLTKTKGGKLGLIAAGIGALLLAGALLLDKLGKKDDKTTPEPNKTDPAPVVTPGEDEKPVVPPNKEDDGETAPDKTKNEYVVKDGDNVWNIAKRHLQEINGKKPTNKEILIETKRLMKVNNLHFEPDNYHVMIHTGDVIKYDDAPKFKKTIEVHTSAGVGTETIEADTQEELDKKIAKRMEESERWKPKDQTYKPEWQK